MYSIKIEDFDLKKIADSGQVFRMNKVGENTYSVIAFGKYVEIKQEENIFTFSCSEEEYKEVWLHYFDLDSKYPIDDMLKYAKAIDDQFLFDAITYGRGIRILNQEFFETLISFIISQRKSIPAIKNCVEKICMKYGNEFTADMLFERKGYKIADYYTFPTFEEFSRKLPQELELINGLNECGIGYRSKYIVDAIDTCLYDNDFIYFLNDLYNNNSKKYSRTWIISKLKSINGVGDKVANCISLFSLHQLESCPIDVWMQKIIDEEYNGVEPEWMKSKYAGLLQQYVFYYKRMTSKGE